MKIKPRTSPAFTLIELLIVVLIIAILAAIAVPNFLEFQTRAKVARAVSDLRTVTTALEAYAVDQNDYPPNDGVFNMLPKELTTPIAYISNNFMYDIFAEQDYHPVYGELSRFYTYAHVLTSEEAIKEFAAGKTLGSEYIDDPAYNPGAIARYGEWRMVSVGPDREYAKFLFPIGPFNPTGGIWGSDVPYDPTNGTVSWGNILRTQKSTDGILP